MRESPAKESQTELRAIKATLRSIHADDPQPTAAPRTPSSQNITSLDTARSKASAKGASKPARRSAKSALPQVESSPTVAEEATPKLSQPHQRQSPANQSPANQSPAKSIALPPIQPRTPAAQIPQFEADPNEPAWDGQVDWQPHLSHRADPLADTVARLQEKSTQYLQQLSQSVWDSPTQQIEIAMQQLEAQAQHVNELATTQESALLELKAIAKQIERDWKNVELTSAAQHGHAETDLHIPPLCEYRQASVPQVEKNDRGVLVVSGRAIDWFKAEREAELTAQALRHRATPASQLKAIVGKSLQPMAARYFKQKRSKQKRSKQKCSRQAACKLSIQSGKTPQISIVHPARRRNALDRGNGGACPAELASDRSSGLPVSCLCVDGGTGGDRDLAIDRPRLTQCWRGVDD